MMARSRWHKVSLILPRADLDLPADVAAKLLPESAYGNLHFPTSFDSFALAMQNIVAGWTVVSTAP